MTCIYSTFLSVAALGSLAEPLKAQENLKKFVKIVIEDVRIRSQLLKLVSPDCECKRAEEAVVSSIVCSVALDYFRLSCHILLHVQQNYHSCYVLPMVYAYSLLLSSYMDYLNPRYICTFAFSNFFVCVAAFVFFVFLFFMLCT